MQELAATPTRIDPETRPQWRRSTRLAVVLGALGALVGFAASWVPSYWGDEAATVVSANRPWGSLATELSVVDGVHGLYYALMHLWVGVFGSSELSTRIPSALAAGLMVAGCVILTRQLTGTRTAALAGIVAIVLPRTTSMATEARSYALGAAAAVWLTVLLVRLLRVRASRRARFAYSVAAAASLYLFLYLGLLLLVHAAYVALVHRERMRRWLAATAWALLFALPIIAVGLLQRDQISFLSRRHYATAANVLVRQWFGSAPVAVIGWAMVIAAVAWGALAVTGRRRGDPQRLALTLLAGLWLVGPTALLLAVNAVGMPAYNVRYLTFSTPAAVVLIALGITAAAELVHREWRRGLTVGILLALVAAAAPVYVSQRLPYSKDGGSDLRDVAAYIDTHAEAGSLIVFDQTTKPSRDPRLALNLYPDDFHAVQDIALVRPAAARAGLWDEVMPNRDALAQTAHGADIWAVELSVGSKTPDDITVLESIGYTVVTADLLHRTTVYHLAKG